MKIREDQRREEGIISLTQRKEQTLSTAFQDCEAKWEGTACALANPGSWACRGGEEATSRRIATYGYDPVDTPIQVPAQGPPPATPITYQDPDYYLLQYVADAEELNEIDQAYASKTNMENEAESKAANAID